MDDDNTPAAAGTFNRKDLLEVFEETEAGCDPFRLHAFDFEIIPVSSTKVILLNSTISTRTCDFESKLKYSIPMLSLSR